MTKSIDLFTTYQALSKQYSTAKWSTPLNLLSIKEEIREAINSGFKSVGNWNYDRQTVEKFIRDWKDFINILPKHCLEEFERVKLEESIRQSIFYAEACRTSDECFYEALTISKGTPSQNLVEVAWQIIQNHPTDFFSSEEFSKENEVPLSSDSVASFMQNALENYGFTDWKIEFHNQMAAEASVVGIKRIVKVNKSASFTRSKLNRLLAHEIGGHVLRWENSFHQSSPWLAVPLGFTVPTEEGLALWTERNLGLLSYDQLKVYAARVIAVDEARHEGVIQVAQLLAPYLGLDAAISVAIRAKRGLLNPNKPGGETKDWGYLSGLIDLSSHFAKYPRDFDIIACNKWSIDDMGILRSLYQSGNLKPPEFYAEQEKLGII